MSDIPYYFDTPVPSDFRKQGWFKNPKCVAFVTWAFSRCQTIEHNVCHDGKTFNLKPFQFIFGRRICAEQTGLTEMEVRTQIAHMIDTGFIKNITSKTTNRFTVYEWVTESFTKINNQQNNQQTTNKQPTDNHKVEVKKEEYKDKEAIAKGAVAFASFHNCLLKLHLSLEEKVAISKNPIDVVERAVWFAELKKKITVKYIQWACNPSQRNLIYNRWWFQFEILNDNPGHFKELKISGDFLTSTENSSKEIHFNQPPEVFQTQFFQVFVGVGGVASAN